MIDDDLQEYPDNDQLVIEEDDRYNEDDMYRKVVKLKSDEDSEDGFKTKVDKFEKRVNKLVYERNTEREKRAELERRLQEVESRVKKEDADKTDSDYSAKMAELKAQYKRHLDISDDDYYDVEKAVEINDQILELKLQERDERSKRSEPEQRHDNSQQRQSEALADWQERNGWVFFAEKNKDRVAKTNEIYNKLLNEEGYSDDDPETFAELDKRLSNESQSKQSEKKPDRQKPPVVSGVDRGESDSQSSGSSNFTRADMDKMKSWGLNPNDSDARAEYLKNKTGK